MHFPLDLEKILCRILYGRCLPYDAYRFLDTLSQLGSLVSHIPKDFILSDLVATCSENVKAAHPLTAEFKNMLCPKAAKERNLTTLLQFRSSQFIEFESVLNL